MFWPRFKTGIILSKSIITTSCCSVTRIQLGCTYHCISILRHEGIMYVGNLSYSCHFCREGNGGSSVIFWMWFQKRKSKWPFWELKIWLSNRNIIVLTAHIHGMILRDVPVHKTWGITSLAGKLMLLGFNIRWSLWIINL